LIADGASITNGEVTVEIIVAVTRLPGAVHASNDDVCDERVASTVISIREIGTSEDSSG
jgi:hypothetical protein